MGLVVLAGAAVADEVRKRGSENARPAAAAPSPLGPRLARAEVGGELLYTDRRCRLHRLALPSLAETARPTAITCFFSVSPSRGRVAVWDFAWAPVGSLFARCRRNRLEIGDAEFLYVHYRLPGCTPAWRPDGSLTAVDRRGVVGFWGCVRARICTRVVLPGRVLAHAAALHADVPSGRRWQRDVRVQSLAWLSATRAAVLLDVRVHGRPREPLRRQLLAVFERRRLVRALPLRPEFSGLRASPRRSLVWARPNLLVRRDGRRLPLRGVHALAWSPDERWTALATSRHVVLVRTARLADPDAVRLWLPLPARDLGWAPTFG